MKTIFLSIVGVGLSCAISSYYKGEKYTLQLSDYKGYTASLTQILAFNFLIFFLELWLLGQALGFAKSTFLTLFAFSFVYRDCTFRQ
jgi:hypothetical protein